MNINFRFVCLFFVLPFFMSCASSYKSISPETLEYHNHSTNDKIEFSYHYDVLTESRNKKYAKHELKNRLSLVAVKITNYTGHDINPMTDAVFYIDNKPAYFVDQRTTVKKIKREFRFICCTYCFLRRLLLPLPVTHTMVHRIQTPSRSD